MNRISSVALAIMLTVTTMSTGSVETSKFQEKNNPLNGFETDENDTLDRTNTFPFDILFDEYYDTSAEVYSDLLVLQNNYP